MPPFVWPSTSDEQPELSSSFRLIRYIECRKRFGPGARHFETARRKFLGLAHFLRIFWPLSVVLWPEEKKMFFAEILGFWLLVGIAFFGWRQLGKGKESRFPRVLPPSDGRGV